MRRAYIAAITRMLANIRDVDTLAKIYRYVLAIYLRK